MEHTTHQDTLEELVTTHDVQSHCSLSIPNELIEGAIRDFAESLAYSAEDGPVHEAGDCVEDTGDNWRSEYAPSWSIYTHEAEEVIAQVGIGETIDYARHSWGYAPGSVEHMINAIVDDLTRAVIAAFENADWSELEDTDD